MKSSVKKRDIKISTWYILYEITQAMLEKMFNVIKNITLDIKVIETKIFDWKDSTSLVRDIMIKKRNIITLKHMFKPQIAVLKQLKNLINDIYKWEIEVYFEDLEDKLDQIVNDINVLQEYMEGVENSFKSIVDIKTNFVIKILTAFSAFMLPLTLVTSFYWMNIDLSPYQNINIPLFLFSIGLSFIVIIYLFLRSGWKF